MSVIRADCLPGYNTLQYLALPKVLGRFGLQASSLMINPQLDGIKGLPVPELGPSWPPPAAESVGSRGYLSRGYLGSRAGQHSHGQGSGGSSSGNLSPSLTEAQLAVNQLFASCEDSDTWTSFSMSPSSPSPSCVPPTPVLGALGALGVLGDSQRTRTRSLCGYTDRRKRAASVARPGNGSGDRLGAISSDQLDEEVGVSCVPRFQHR